MRFGNWIYRELSTVRGLNMPMKLILDRMVLLKEITILHEGVCGHVFEKEQENQRSA